jgi:hypothetical protein
LNRTDENKEIVPTQQPKLELVTGGKGGPGHNWLGDMEIGTVFAAKDKLNRETTFLATQFEVVHKHQRTMVLASNLNDPPQYVSVLPLQFSIRFDLVEVIYDPKSITDDSLGSE